MSIDGSESASALKAEAPGLTRPPIAAILMVGSGGETKWPRTKHLTS
jgi:hypothetical protein